MDYEEFRKQYEIQHPASVPVLQDMQSEYPSWLSPLALLMFLAVSLVSGVHTVSTMRYTMIESMVIPENAKDIIALSAFFGFEIALFVSVFSWIRQQRRWLSYLATAVVFVVILLANVRDIQRAADNSVMDIVMIVGIGVGTPLVALVSGKLFVDIYHSKHNARRRTMELYREEMKQWDAAINREYAKLTKTHQVSTGQAVRADGQRTDKAIMSGYGYNRTSDAQDKVRAHLEAHPEDFTLSVRALADKLEVGKSTVADVRRVLQEPSANGNGHTPANGRS